MLSRWITWLNDGITNFVTHLSSSQWLVLALAVFALGAMLLQGTGSRARQ